jgi:hypothetical protein
MASFNGRIVDNFNRLAGFPFVIVNLATEFGMTRGNALCPLPGFVQRLTYRNGSTSIRWKTSFGISGDMCTNVKNKDGVLTRVDYFSPMSGSARWVVYSRPDQIRNSGSVC